MILIDINMPPEGFQEIILLTHNKATVSSNTEWKGYKEFKAISIPSHGRLIDADAFKKRCIDGLESFKEEFTSQRGLELASMVYDDFFACIDAQPTVIPAEQGEEL